MYNFNFATNFLLTPLDNEWNYREEAKWPKEVPRSGGSNGIVNGLLI